MWAGYRQLLGALNANTRFGGVKESGFGRDMGEEALDSWLTTKVIKHNILPRIDG
jgi:aldehyde dehydrogenase (NAD+)